MMMNRENFNSSSNLAVHVPPWDLGDDPTATVLSPFKLTTTVSVDGNNNNNNATSPNGDFSPLDALHRYLPSNTTTITDFHGDDDSDIPADAFSCDQFRMYEFKVRKCARARSHDWTECPYAHPGEKARRRDPRKYHYSGTACPEFRKGMCKKGETCEYAHGVFECWLHPARYRTQPCKDGTHCRRRVCFFAHTADQLRIWSHTYTNNNSFKLSDSYDGSPSRLGIDSFMMRDSPTSTLYSPPSVSPPSDSPPMSPNRANSVSELALSMRNLRMSVSPPAWGVGMGSGFCSPRSPSKLRPGFLSLPSTPIRAPSRHGLGVFDLWDQTCEEEPVMERVESGKDLRAKIYSKLSKDNSLDRVDSEALVPDLGWVSELIE